MKKLIILSVIGMAGIALLAGCKKESKQPVVHPPTRWSSSEVAAPDSVEGQLRADGKKWVKIPGEIKVGSYVQDILEGRLNQPQGRGAVGKVISMSRYNGQLGASVDFGRGNIADIYLSELSLVAVE